MNKEPDLVKWAHDSMRNVITTSSDLDNVEDQYIKYQSMPKDHRRQADWKSLELTGETNIDRYNRLKNTLSRKDLPPDKEKEYDGTDTVQHVNEAVADDVVDYTRINYTQKEVDSAIDYSHDAMRTIIIPTRTLEDLEEEWIKFNSMPRKHQRESDWKSIELFGIDNATHYNYLKSKFVKRDIPEDIEDMDSSIDNATSIISESYIERKCRFISSLNPIEDIDYIMEATTELANTKDATFCEDILIKQTIDSTVQQFKDNIADVDMPFIPYLDLPFFDPTELTSLGVYNKADPALNLYSVEPDNNMLSDTITTEQWFEEYKKHFYGFATKDMQELSDLRVRKLKELYSDFDDILESENKTKINARKQSILELGWNPNIPFDDKNRSIAYNETAEAISQMTGKTRFIDMRLIDSAIDESITTVGKVPTKIASNINTHVLKPIYIVLVEGVSIFSAAVKKVTHGPFSHASIGFEPRLNRLYSFNANEKKGGISIESIDMYPPDSKLAVYAIFVKDKELKKIHKMVDSFIENRDKTGYSYTNILTMLFHIPFNRDWKMVCSQFVDRVLKVANIDLTKKDSSLVTPNDFASISYKNKNIYIAYDGIVDNYNAKKIEKMINNSIDSAKYIMENLLLSELADMLSIKPVIETKEFPVQFDVDGNLLIKNMRKLDYDAEFAKSHKLLKEYDKTDNIEGMKYEISKLWFMNSAIEKSIYAKPGLSDQERRNNVKVRALILNDFKKYLNVVLKKDNKFNFTEYYNSTPFSDATIKVNRTTLKYTIDMIKSVF